MVMGTFAIQLTTLLSLVGGNILFGSLPLLGVRLVGHFSYTEHEWSRKLKWATFFLYFGGGVFLSDSFLLLLPQARRHFEKQEVHSHEEVEEPSGHHHESFPIPEFVVMCGFFIAYVLQEMMYFFLFKCNATARRSSDLRVSFCSCAKRHTECSRTYKGARSDQTMFGLEKTLLESGNATNSTATLAIGPPDVSMCRNGSKSDLLRSSIIIQTVPNYGTLTNITEPATDSPLPVLSPPILIAEERRIAEEQEIVTRDQNKLLVSSILTVIALFLQYIFRGFALGLRTASPIKWGYLVVMCVQNFLLTFSASSDLTVGNMEHIYIAVHIAVLSFIAPIGMLFAMLRSHSVEGIPPLAKGTVAAVSCGVLLYTTFYEMLRQKKLGSVAGLTKFSAIILGACTMAALQYAIFLL